jgi:TIR domain
VGQLVTLSQAEPSAQPPAEGIADAPLKIFINYRRSDTGGYAWALYFKLAAAFGAEHVFFDGVSLEPGVRWLQEIKSQATGAAVFLALIGESWLGTLVDRMTADDEDILVKEISRALLNAPPLTVIPVLINDAPPPPAPPLPIALKGLPDLQADQMRHAQLADDIDRLIVHIQRIRAAAAMRQDA